MDPSVVFTLSVAAVVLCAGIFSTKLASRIGVPALVLFIAAGMVLGSDVLGLIYFDDARLAQLVATAALVVILFEGGLQTRWSQMRRILAPSVTLATLGVVVTVVITGVFAWRTLDLDIPMAMLLAATVGSTDAAAIFAVLRDRQIKQRLKATVEAESGLNDPMALFLTQIFLTWVQTGSLPIGQAILLLIWQMAVGLAIGLAMGRLVSLVVLRARFDSGGLYPLLLLANALLTFAVATWVQGSGIVAVYVLGIVLGGSDLPYRQSSIRFHEGTASLAQIIMFSLLGLLVFPSRMVPVIVPGLLLAAGLMFIARPVAVWLCTLGTGYSKQEILLLAWAGLKGAVPIILATFPLVAGVPQSDLIFHMVFFVVLTSALIQGSSISLLARRLGLVEATSRPKPISLELIAVEKSNADLIEVEITPGTDAEGKQLAQLNLPANVTVSAIVRHDKVVTPRGVTRLEAGDILFVLAERGQREHVTDFFAGEEELPAPGSAPST
ncbi:potassium/proton antiporter [Limnochorda pilosa]|uniref:Potassium transporter n=1 Tax=Limnochorda pilosa TaxID=1555112 RepID=A0A0K2SHC5_LIMPI|nr:potassium/proton antiporter [Limnochorda pilosa]BAS26518.1 potassium transporter [Limnochorda pilosa]